VSTVVRGGAAGGGDGRKLQTEVAACAGCEQKVLLQSTGVPLPRPGLVSGDGEAVDAAVSVALPLLERVTDCAALVLPSLVKIGQGRRGGYVVFTYEIRTKSAM